MSRQNRTLYVANLPWRMTEDDLAEAFREFGPVLDVRIIQDRLTGRSLGYGFVELADPELAAHAIEALSGRRFQGRALVIRLACPKPPRH